MLYAIMLYAISYMLYAICYMLYAMYASYMNQRSVVRKLTANLFKIRHDWEVQ